MRRIDAIALALVVVVISGGLTYYVARNPLRGDSTQRIEIGPKDSIKKLSPREILAPPTPTPAEREQRSPDSSGSSVATTAPAVLTAVIVHPPWKPGHTRVEGAYAVTKPGQFIRPEWSPLGLDIAFTTQELKGLWVAGPNTTDARLLSDDKLPEADFFWGSDGMQIYVFTPDRRPVALMLTGEKYPLPELRRAVFEREGNIYYETEEGEIRRITGSQDRFYGARLSPDESLVAYAGTETGLYISSLDGKRTISVGKGQHPAWLPDSSGIVYDIPISDGNRLVDGDLWFAAADGSERTNITDTPGIIESWPAISPDGGRIAFVAEGAVYVGKFVRPRR